MPRHLVCYDGVMAVSRVFADALSRIRQRQGFPTAHSFYKLRAGRRSLRMTFRNYLNLEQGKSLPKPERFEALAAALGLEEHSAAARELAEAYLSALGLVRLTVFLGKKEDIFSTHEDAHLMELAARQALQSRLAHLSTAQWGILARDYEAYVCDDLLQNTSGGLELASLARQAGLSPAAAKRAVSALVAAGLAEVAGRRVRSSFEGRIVEDLPTLPATMRTKAGMLKNQARQAQEGKLVGNSVFKVRLGGAGLQQVQRRVDQLSTVAGLYEESAGGADSGVYMVRTQVFRLFPREPH